MQEKDQEISSLRSELTHEKETSEGSSRALSELEARFADVTADFEKTVLELDLVSKAKQDLEEDCKGKSELVQKLESSVSDLSAKIKESEETFDDRMEATELVQDLRRKLVAAEDDLADKRKIIKLHGQRIADIKKTMQKEMMKASATSGPLLAENGHSAAASDRSGSTPTPPLLQHSPSASGSFDAAQLVLSPTITGIKILISTI